MRSPPWTYSPSISSFGRTATSSSASPFSVFSVPVSPLGGKPIRCGGAKPSNPHLYSRLAGEETELYSDPFRINDSNDFRRGPGNPPMTPFPRSQFGNKFSPNQTVYHSQGPHQTRHANMNHLRMDSSFPGQHGTPGSSRSGNINSHNPGAFCSPGFSSGEARGLMGRHGSGRGSPSPNSGRGEGRWFGNSGSPDLGRSGQRGSRPRAEVSAVDRPELFYNRSTMGDPWESLTPFVWNSPATGSWLPRSISMKKSGVTETPGKVNLHLSLAEYLAASFNGAADAAGYQLD